MMLFLLSGAICHYITYVTPWDSPTIVAMLSPDPWHLIPPEFTWVRTGVYGSDWEHEFLRGNTPRPGGYWRLGVDRMPSGA